MYPIFLTDVWLNKLFQFVYNNKSKNLNEIVLFIKKNCLSLSNELEEWNDGFAFTTHKGRTNAMARTYQTKDLR